MRVDGKPEGLRQSMSWLHTWSGLLLGWLLYAVFFTGTLSYFLEEINTWMRPELHASEPAKLSIQHAIAGMQRLAPTATFWALQLPDERTTSIQVTWRERDAPRGRAGTKHAEMDAATGKVITPRDTGSGMFLYRFHFQLYAMPRIWGRWIVGAAAIVMFVAILSGVVTHRRIFTDFFTFRPRKGPRSWLDAHNATAVLALPFHFVITFSGLLLLTSVLMPWSVEMLYGDHAQAYFAERRGSEAVGPAPDGQPPLGATNLPLASIKPMLMQAITRWPDHGVGLVVIEYPGTNLARVELRERGGRSLVNQGAGERMLFDGQSGERIDTPPPTTPPPATAVHNILTAPHLGRFASFGTRWLLFFAGLIGTTMVASGMVLWVMKRLPERAKSGAVPRGHRLVEILNVAAIAGLPISTACYFWSNRLLPTALQQRAEWEIRAFFIAWLICLIHASLRQHRCAWREQFSLAALMFALLPIINPLTGGAGLWHSIPRSQWAVVEADFLMLILAGLSCYVALQLRNKRPVLAKEGMPDTSGHGALALVRQDKELAP